MHRLRAFACRVALRALCLTRGHRRKPLSNRCAFCERPVCKPFRLPSHSLPRGAA